MDEATLIVVAQRTHAQTGDVDGLLADLQVVIDEGRFMRDDVVWIIEHRRQYMRMMYA
jgi:hypothetical protein